jgi:hypothetical protein
VAEHEQDDLVRDLTALGRSADVSAPSERLATAVLERVAELPAPATRRLLPSLASRRRRIAIAVVAVLVALVATPPVRAAVADWFGFGGVRVEKGSAPSGEASPPPEVPADGSVSQAAGDVDFTIWVPAELADPDGVEVSADRRIVSMSWSATPDGVVRLDQLDGRLDFSIAKTSPGVQYAAVGGTDALWFEEPHEVVLLDADGTRRTESARLAGHTLIWQQDETTLRIEGDLSLQRAVAIAESVAPLG